MSNTHSYLHFWIIFLTFCAFLRSELLSPEDFGFKSFEALKESFKKRVDGGFSVVYSIKNFPEFIFKHIDVENNCKDRLYNINLFRECVSDYNADTRQEILILERLQGLYDQKSIFDFKPYLTKYWGHLEGPRNQFILVQEKLAYDLIDADFVKYLPVEELTKRLWTYLNIIRAIFVPNAIGINHCDIKPDNLMFKNEITSKEDLPADCVVIDFGKANFNTFCEIGTESYADPNIKAGSSKNKVFNIKDTKYADIYSTGITLLLLEINLHTNPMPKLIDNLPHFINFINKNFEDSPKKPIYIALSEIFTDMLQTENRRTNMLQVMAQLELLIYKAAKIEGVSLSKFENTAKWLANLKKAIPLALFNPANFPMVSPELGQIVGQALIKKTQPIKIESHYQPFDPSILRMPSPSNLPQNHQKPIELNARLNKIQNPVTAVQKIGTTSIDSAYKIRQSPFVAIQKPEMNFQRPEMNYQNPHNQPEFSKILPKQAENSRIILPQHNSKSPFDQNVYIASSKYNPASKQTPVQPNLDGVGKILHFNQYHEKNMTPSSNYKSPQMEVLNNNQGNIIQSRINYHDPRFEVRRPEFDPTKQESKIGSLQSRIAVEPAFRIGNINPQTYLKKEPTPKKGLQITKQPILNNKSTAFNLQERRPELEQMNYIGQGNPNLYRPFKNLI